MNKLIIEEMGQLQKMVMNYFQKDNNVTDVIYEEEDVKVIYKDGQVLSFQVKKHE